MIERGLAGQGISVKVPVFQPISDHFMRKILFALILSCTFAHAGISIEKLPADDSLTIAFKTKAPTGTTGYEFAFSNRGNVTVTAVSVEFLPEEKGKPLEEKSRLFLGVYKLTKKEVSGLEALLAYYRTMPKGDCKTVDEITLSQTSGDQNAGSESYTDATCATAEMKDVTTFPQLLEKIKGGGR